MRTLIRLRAAIVVVAFLAACASPPPSIAPVAPKYPSLIFPAMPEQLARDAALSELHQRAWAALQAGDTRAADREFRMVLDRNPAFYPAEAGLGQVALARRDYKDALTRFEHVLAISARYVPALVARGDALVALGREADAASSYEAALEVSPGLPGLREKVDALRFRTVEDVIADARKARDAGHDEDARAAYEKAIQASPQAAFLYRELASVERRQNRLDDALAHLRRAAELDPSDARAHVLAGEILESRQDYAGALNEYQAAAAIEPSDELTNVIDRARENVALADLPAEFRAIASDPAVDRAGLAALIGVRLEDLLRQSPRRDSAVITDARASWAARWITAVVRAGIMDPFPNHTFQPTTTVKRSELAEVVARLLPLAAARTPKKLDAWRGGRPKFADLPPGHLSYPAAAMAVEAGVLTPMPDGAFAPGAVVSGQEATAAIDKINKLARTVR
jgi:tetratricopeptide (TPR) repeat protein